MDVEKIAKSTQEQGVAAWIDYLNQLRIQELLSKLAAQDMNLEQAVTEICCMKDAIRQILLSNRGGEKGIHGFLVEPAEVGVDNAKRLIEGLKATNYWVNDNGPVDFIRNGVPYQQKFVQENFSLGKATVKDPKGILEHFLKYKDTFLNDGSEGQIRGKYQIPKDFYEKVKLLHDVNDAKVATRLFQNREDGLTFRDWKSVKAFFDAHPEISMDDIEPSLFNYDEVQRDTIGKTVQREERKILERNQEIRDDAYEASKPTLQEGIKVVSVSAAMEGGMTFCLGVWKKHKQGRCLSEFTAEDWKDVGIDTTKGTVQGAIRGGAVYTMTNFTATPAAVANAFVTAAFGVTGQGIKFRRGEISAEEFVENSEILCLDVSISAVSAMLGQAVIPVPVLGAMIGNVAGMFMYQIAKDNLGEKEQMLIQDYQESLAALNQTLDKRYHALLAMLKKELEKFSSMLELAFDPDVNIAFDGSIALADYVGVTPEKVLRNKQDIDQYFLN